MKKRLRILLLLIPAVALAFSVYIDSTDQRTDGSQLWDIWFTIGGISSNDTVRVFIDAATESGEKLNCVTLSGDYPKVCGPGSYHIVWDFGIDVPNREFYYNGIQIGVAATKTNITPGQCGFCLAAGDTFSTEYGSSIVQTCDGGYAMSGEMTNWNYNSMGLLAVKLGFYSDLDWARVVADTSFGHSIVETADSGYVVTGEKWEYGEFKSDLFLIKFAYDGDLEWATTVGDSNLECGYWVIQTSDGGYAVTGFTSSYGAGSSDLFLVKFDSAADVEWARTVGAEAHDCGYSLVQASDDGYLVAGYTGLFGGNNSLLLVKFNSAGDLEWARVVDNTSYETWGYSVIQTSDNGYAVAGFVTNIWTTSPATPFLLKLDSSGIMEWGLTLNSPVYPDYGPNCDVVQADDGGYVLASTGMDTVGGSYRSKTLLTKINSSGLLDWASEIYGRGWGVGYGQLIHTTDDGYVVFGDDYVYNDRDLFLAKFDSHGNTCCAESTYVQILDFSPDLLDITPLVTDVVPHVHDVTDSLIIYEVYPPITEICTE